MALRITPQEIIDKHEHPLLEIAERWERVPLDHVAQVQNGYAFSSEHFNHESGLPLIRIRDIKSKTTENLYSGEYQENYIVRNGDFLIGMDGDFNISKWPGEMGLLNQRVCRILPLTKLYDQRFVFIVLQPYLDAIHTETSAVTVKHLSSKTISAIPLPLPPLPEQRAIVDKLETLLAHLDNSVAEFEQARTKLALYRQAVLQQAFEGELTAAWRAAQPDLPTPAQLLETIAEDRATYYAERLQEWEEAVAAWEAEGKVGRKPAKPRAIKSFASPIRKVIKKMPPEWLKTCIGNISIGVSYGTSTKSSKEGKVPVLRMGNMQNGLIDWEDLVYSNDEEDNQKYLLSEGDVLFNRTNSPELVGKTSIISSDRPAIYAGYLIRLNHLKSLIASKYLNYYLNSHTAKVYGSYVKTDGVNQSNINGQKLSNYPLPLPSLPEQYQIVTAIETRLSVCDELGKTIDAQLERAQALRRSVLKRAFAGELLNDEELADCRAAPDYAPASELLERIREERAARLAAKQKKRKTPKKTKRRASPADLFTPKTPTP